MKKIKLRNGKQAEFQKAKGVKGFLLNSPFNKVLFRVYDKDYNFKDYDITHYDLEITVSDEHACLYHLDDGSMIIDYSPEALGYKDDDE